MIQQCPKLGSVHPNPEVQRGLLGPKLPAFTTYETGEEPDSRNSIANLANLIRLKVDIQPLMYKKTKLSETSGANCRTHHHL